MDKINKLQKMIDESNNIVFFGGAGVSTESGIPDFRSADGLYSENRNFKISPETILSYKFFKKYPEKFYEFYKQNLCYPDAQPNAAHFFLAELEKAGKLKAVITQNVDGLHQLAGSKNVIELHGSAQRNYCVKCKKEYDFSFVYKSEGVPKCKCGGTVRPDVVLYNEMLPMGAVLEAKEALWNADMLIIAGTSLSVYPAASYINYFRGDNIVLINLNDCDESATENLNRKKDFLFIKDKVGAVFSLLKI